MVHAVRVLRWACKDQLLCECLVNWQGVLSPALLVQYLRSRTRVLAIETGWCCICIAATHAPPPPPLAKRCAPTTHVNECRVCFSYVGKTHKIWRCVIQLDSHAEQQPHPMHCIFAVAQMNAQRCHSLVGQSSTLMRWRSRVQVPLA